MPRYVHPIRRLQLAPFAGLRSPVDPSMLAPVDLLPDGTLARAASNLNLGSPPLEHVRSTASARWSLPPQGVLQPLPLHLVPLPKPLDLRGVRRIPPILALASGYLLVLIDAESQLFE